MTTGPKQQGHAVLTGLGTRVELAGRKTGRSKHAVCFTLAFNDNVLFSNILCFFSDFPLFSPNVLTFYVCVCPVWGVFRGAPFHIYISHTVLFSIFSLIDLCLLLLHLWPLSVWQLSNNPHSTQECPFCPLEAGAFLPPLRTFLIQKKQSSPILCSLEPELDFPLLN